MICVGRKQTPRPSLNARVFSLLAGYAEKEADGTGGVRISMKRFRRDMILTGLVSLGSGRDRCIVRDLLEAGVLHATGVRGVCLIDRQALTAAVSSMDPHPEAAA